MDKLVDVLFGMSIALAVGMMTACMLLLPEYQPPNWVGYTVIAAMAVFMGVACLISIYGSVRGK